MHGVLLFLAPHQVGYFRISRFISDGIWSNKALSGGLSAILQSGLILENIQRMSKFMSIVLVALTAKTFFECSQEFD